MAKRYNVRHKLTWFAPTSCWKKYHRGRVYYLGRGQCRNKSDKAGYETALREWIQLHATVVSADPADSEPLYADPRQFGGVSLGLATNYTALGAKAKTAAPKASAALPPDIAGLANAYLAECRTLAESGQICRAQYSDMLYRLNDFVAYCNHVEAIDIADLTNSLLAGYRQVQLGLIALPKPQGGISAVSVKKRLQFLGRFVEWLADREVIDAVPKIVNRKFAAVKLPAPQPKFFTPVQVQAVLADATPLMRACILLGLNCGFTQADIATLEHSHIDQKTQVLKRPRNKTGVESEFQLWPETLEAIQAIRTKPKDSRLVLLSETGKTLLRETFRDDGHMVRVDSIGKSFAVVLNRCGIKGLAFKHLRKTSADLINQKYPPHITDKFLAHISSVMRRHYAREHATDEFREALKYLRQIYFGVPS